MLAQSRADADTSPLALSPHLTYIYTTPPIPFVSPFFCSDATIAGRDTSKEATEKIKYMVWKRMCIWAVMNFAGARGCGQQALEACAWERGYR